MYFQQILYLLGVNKCYGYGSNGKQNIQFQNKIVWQ